jgi:hypothetical protein
MDIWGNFEYEGESYYVEIFYLSGHTIKAFAKKITKINGDMYDSLDVPVGAVWDIADSKKAAIQAIKSLRTQYPSKVKFR